MRKIKPRGLRPLLPYFLLAIAIIVTYKVINELGFFVGCVQWLWKVISPFFGGFLLAYIVNIPCVGIQTLLDKSKVAFIRKRKKLLSVIIVFLVFALIIYSILNLVIPAVYNSISLFVNNLPSYYERTLSFVDDINNLEIFGLYISEETVLTTLQDMFQGLSAESLTSMSLNALSGVSSAIFSGFLAFISSIYILIEKEKALAFIRRLLRAFTSPKVFGAVTEYVGKLDKYFRQYIKTQTLDGIILGTLATIELLIIGSPYALILGIMLGVVNYIPYFGSLFGSITTVIVVAFTQGMTIAAITAAVLLVTQQIDGNIIQPRLMSDSFSLSPLLIIISITIGGAVAGIFGMIAAIPIVAVLKDILEVAVANHELKKFGGEGESG